LLRWLGFPNVASRRRLIRMNCDWGKRPPLWWSMTESEAAEQEKIVQEARAAGSGYWSAVTPAELALRAQAERDRWPITPELLDRLDAWADD
jgi:hypothetical protein